MLCCALDSPRFYKYVLVHGVVHQIILFGGYIFNLFTKLSKTILSAIFNKLVKDVIENDKYSSLLICIVKTILRYGTRINQQK